MAVYPDRIVLKNSTDDQATIEAAIQTGGTDEITQGELVLGLENSTVSLYTKAGDGSIVSFTPDSASGRAIVSASEPTIGVNGLPLTEGDLWFETGTGAYYVYYNSSWVEISGATGGGTVVSIDVAGGTGLTSTGGPVTTTGTITIDLDDTAVTPGGYSNPTITVDAQGRITAATEGEPPVENLSDLSDVNTVDNPPITNQVLSWNGITWVPATIAGGGGGGSTGTRLTETQTASFGLATFTGLGHHGILVSVTSSLDAWIALYGSTGDAVADASRAFGDDPSTGSGVLAEFYITAGSTVLATPGTSYFNNDFNVTEALYAAVRDQTGANVDSQLTIVAYGDQTITSVSGGTFGSGV